jgi:hypothetical protein
MSTTIDLTNEPKTGKPRTLTITVNNVNLSYSVDLKDTDGTIIIEGKPQTFNSSSGVVGNGPAAARLANTDPNKEAKDTLLTGVAELYATYYKTVNG